MKRLLLALVLLLAGAVSALQLQGTFAGVNDVEQAGAHFQAATDSNATHDPGHAYVDVDDDGLFSNATDREIVKSELADGRYVVSEASHGLVIPRSVGALETDAAMRFEAGADASLTIEVKLEAPGDIELVAGDVANLEGLVAETERELSIQAGDRVDLRGATLETGDRAAIATEAGPVHLTDASIEATGPIEVDAGGDVRLDDARLETAVSLDVTAGEDLHLKRATLEAGTEIILTAGSPDATIFVEGARIADADDVAQAGPDGVEIVGEPAEGEVR